MASKKKPKQAPALALKSIIKTYCFRLLLAWRQHLKMEKILELQCALYNGALQERIDAYKKIKKTISYHNQAKSLTLIRAADKDDKKDKDGYGVFPANLSRATLKRLDEAYKGFFRRIKLGGKPGFPRFKGKNRWDSFGFAEFSGITFGQGKIRFKGMPGSLKVHMHRPIPPGAEFLSCQFKRDAKGWTVSFQVRENMAIPAHTGPEVGIDVGIYQFAVISDGEVIPSLGSTKRHFSRLRREQRKLARAQKGSKSRQKQKQVLARIHLDMANTRDTFLHAHSARIAKKYSVIGLEDLNIQNMSKSAAGTKEKPGKNVRQKAGLNRSIMNAGWGKFSNMISYKAAWAGGKIIKVNPQHTSQVCSNCGDLARKELSERTHKCGCGLEIDRDLNAARNIKALAQAELKSWHEPECLAGRSGSGLVVSRGSKARLPVEKSVKVSN